MNHIVEKFISGSISVFTMRDDKNEALCAVCKFSMAEHILRDGIALSYNLWGYCTECNACAMGACLRGPLLICENCLEGL